MTIDQHDDSLKSGFSIVEMLVVVGLIGLLLAITIPAIARSRQSARHGSIQATTRQHLTIFQLYLGDYRDVHPWFGMPDESGRLNLSLPNGGSPYQAYYFETCSAWAIPMASYYSDMWPHASQTYPGPIGTARYLYSCAMIADPAFWNTRSRLGASQWRATRSSEVRYPARKALITGAVDQEPFPDWISDGLTLGLCDGAVRFILKPDLCLPVVAGDGPSLGLYHVRGYYGLDTVDGVHGVDVSPQ